ncbi:MAG TPA: type II 3-dehydroquinate dehydratase [Jatrophihabitans sp.]|jgi:3-dehydroquinate dehydratase-2|uniref:type II 3-dehydroquinate dehydratase n=1 Tax=Jatrophihabitans sp. TaxID=1932789 RepID=UPI002EF3CFC1
MSEDRSDEGAGPVRVLVLNGPNLGRLGSREPEIYGSTTYPELAALCVRAGAELGLAVEVHQSDAEAELIGWLHQAADQRLPVVLNPAGLSHTSIVLRDAVAARTAPLVEVHISNIHAREQFRHHSHVSAVASGVIAGLGVEGYVLALSWLSSTAADRPQPSQ